MYTKQQRLERITNDELLEARILLFSILRVTRPATRDTKKAFLLNKNESIHFNLKELCNDLFEAHREILDSLQRLEEKKAMQLRNEDRL